MILKRQEKNGTIKAMYSSSTLCASIFDTKTKDLTIIFKNGGQYKYPNVAMTDYTRVETAESNGSVFNTYIKKKYPNFEKLDKLDESSMAVLLKEIDTLKEAEDKASIEGTSKEMMEVMAGMVASYVGTGKVNSDMLTRLENKISAYNKVVTPEPSQVEP